MSDYILRIGSELDPSGAWKDLKAFLDEAKNNKVKFEGEFDIKNISKALDTVKKEMIRLEAGIKSGKYTGKALDDAEENLNTLARVFTDTGDTVRKNAGKLGTKEFEAFEKDYSRMVKDLRYDHKLLAADVDGNFKKIENVQNRALKTAKRLKQAHLTYNKERAKSIDEITDAIEKEQKARQNLEKVGLNPNSTKAEEAIAKRELTVATNNRVDAQNRHRNRYGNFSQDEQNKFDEIESVGQQKIADMQSIDADKRAREAASNREKEFTKVSKAAEVAQAAVENYNKEVNAKNPSQARIKEAEYFKNDAKNSYDEQEKLFLSQNGGQYSKSEQDTLDKIRLDSDRRNARIEGVKKEREAAEAVAETNKENLEYDKSRVKEAERLMGLQDKLNNSARTMGNSTQAEKLRNDAKAINDSIDDILADEKLSNDAFDNIFNKWSNKEESNRINNSIQEQRDSFKQAGQQANIYAKGLNSLYNNYKKFNVAARRAPDGSDEQRYLQNQADWFLDQFDTEYSKRANSLTDAQRSNLAQMQVIGNYDAAVAEAQKEASIYAGVRSQQYKDIYNTQKHINDLQQEQSKYASGSQMHKQYGEVIEANKQSLVDMKLNYGEMDSHEQSILNSLNKEYELRKEAFEMSNKLDSRDKSIARNNFESRLSANSRMKRYFGDEIDELRSGYDKASTYAELKDLQKTEQDIFAQAKADGKDGMTLVDRIKNNFKDFGASIVGQFLSPYAVANAVRNVAKAMYSNVAEMDASMTELYKVTDNSQREYQEYSKGVKRTSMEIGATQTSLVQATATFARLGYNLNDSAELGKNAALFANVGDEGMTSGEAATDMVAVMKGFNIQAEDSLHIVDAFNKVGNEFAISSTGIGESLKRSGGALATANNSLEESIGLTVAANDAMQDPAATGTALKTIALRIRGMKNELADAGEDTTGMAKSTAKLRDSLIQLGGVDILADGGEEFKSTYEIMGELAKNWDSISDMGKASIIEQVAGKRGASFFSSMMTNWKDAEDAYAAAMNSAGSAEKENQAYLNSIAGKQAQFKSAFESLSNDLLDSDMVKFGVDAGRNIVQGIDDVINATGGGMKTTLGATGLIVGAHFGTSVAKGFAKSQGFESIGEAFARLGTGKALSGIGGALKATKFAGALSSLLPQIFLIGGAASIAYGVYKDWDNATETITESQDKLNNSLTNYKSAQTQIATIDKHIQENESEINDIRNRGISSIKDSSRLEQLNAENNQLRIQKQYQSAIADAEYNVSAASARAAMNNQDAYARTTKNGKTTYEKADASIFGKISLAFDEITGFSKIAQDDGYYLSHSEYLDALTDSYVNSRKNLNELMSSKGAANKVKEIEAAQQEYSDNAKEFQLGLSDYYGYLEALTDPQTGSAKRGFEQEYKQARNQVNKMLRADQGNSRFIETLLGYGEYAELQSQLTDMALNNGFTDGWENSSKAMQDFIAEAESAGMVNAADSIEGLFESIGTGSDKAMVALAIVEDNLQAVTDGISDFETRIANSSKAAQEGFSSTGLSFAAQATLGTKYESAMMKTANGLRLNYAEYQKSKKEAISSQMASYARDIKEQQDIGSGLLNQYADLEKKISNIKNAPDAAFSSDSERVSRLANLQQQLAETGNAIQIVQGNIRTLNDAQVELTGLDSKLNNYLETTSGAFEDTKNLDAIGDTFAKVKEDFTDGWTSGAQARAFTDLWTYEDMTKASNQEVSESFEEAEANMGKFYDMVSNTQKDGTTTWKAFKNGAKIVDELSGAQEKLGKSFMDADKNIKLTTSDIANIAKVWGISESAATELLQALNSYGYNVKIVNNGKSLEQIEENAAGAQEALDKYSDGLIASKDLYDDYEESMERSRNVGAYDSTAERHYKQEAEAKKQLIEAEDRLQKLQDAREAASEDAARTGDYSASDALGAELVQTARYQAQLKHRNELENNLMNFDTSKVTGDFKNRIEMLKDVQNAVEGLQTAQTVDQFAPGYLGPDAVKKAEGEVDRTYGELAHYIAENGLANKFDGLSTDATEQEISDFLKGMDLSDVAQDLKLDLSEAKITGQENLAASIAETANSSVTSMIENANAINEALKANNASGELTMNSDGSYSIKLTPEVDKSKLTEDVAEGTSDGYEKAAEESTSESIKGQYEYGDTKTEWRQEGQLSSGGRPDFGEGVVVNNAKLTGEIDTSGVNPEIDAKVKPTEILTESFEDSGQTLEMPAEVSDIEVPKGDAETLNFNGKVDNIEVPDGAGKDVKLEGTIDNVKVPDNAGEAVQIEGDVNVSEVPEVQGTANYVGEFPAEAPTVQGTAIYTPGIFPTSAPTVYGTAVYSGDFPDSAPTISGTVIYSGSFPSGGGGGDYDGTAHYNGSAYSSGNWGVKQSQKALVGELGMETVVYGGRYWTVGDTGAEFANIPKGAIVFNHKQTEELFKNGHISTKGGRGTIAHANGTAYASGNAFASGSDPTDFDYAAIKIDRLNDDINLLADTMELFDKYAKQNALAQQEIGKIHEAILANEQAYNYYLSKANEVGLDEGHVEKIKNGTIEIEAIGDDDLKKKVDNYKKWYDAALNTQSAIVKLKKELQEISKIKLDNIEDEFQWWKDWRQAVLDRREATIDLYKEQHGHDSVGRLRDSAKHYTAFISELEDRMSHLQKEINAQVASGELQKYSKAWYEATQRCVEARTEIIELQLKLEEINNTIREANWNNFNKMLDKFSSLRDEIDTAYDFVGDMNPFRDDASLNANGKAQLAMLQDGLINARQEVKNYSVAYKALNKELKQGIISQDEYDEKLQDLRKDQLDAAETVKKYRDAILDLVRDGIEKETEVFEKLISVRQENLRKQKEADDYARTVRDKTKDINSIQAQIAALSGDDSLATRAQIRELESKLQEAQQDLDDTRRDHEYDVMSKAYDKELDDFKEIQDKKLQDLDTYLDSQDAAIKNALGIIKKEYQATYARMDNIAKLYGITLNDSILNPWVSAKKAVQEYNKAIAKPKKVTVKIETGNYVKTTKKKARGTYNASSGLTLTDEDGMEAILTKEGVLRQLDSGDTVFNARQREMLWKISKMSPSALIKPSINATLSSGNSGMNGDININYDITIQGNATESTVADIDEVCKRAAEYTKNDMVKSFRKIGIAI